MKKYFVICKSEGQNYYSIETEKSLSEIRFAQEQIGYEEELHIYDPEAGMKEVDIDSIVSEYRRQEAEVQAEYEEYCETVNEYGYGYYENSDMLEMGFDPYEGDYTYDC